jgi:hypothetical protein
MQLHSLLKIFGSTSECLANFLRFHKFDETHLKKIANAFNATNERREDKPPFLK